MGEALCQVPCSCVCMEVQTKRVAVTVGGKAYLQCACDMSHDACCDEDTATGRFRTMSDNGVAAFDGLGSTLESCKCQFTGTFDMCEDGDFNNTIEPLEAVIRLHDSDVLSVEATFLGTKYRGLLYNAGAACVIACYETSEFEGNYYPQYGAPYLSDLPGNYLTMLAETDHALIIELSITSSQEACKEGRCVISHSVTKGGAPTYTPRGRLTSKSQGACPTVTTGEAWPETPATGWQCRIAEGMLDCEGSTMPDIYEYITHRGGYYPPVPQGSCNLDCGDLFLVPYSGGSCMEFEDPPAWWAPMETDGWYTKPRTPCIMAERHAWVVWTMKIDCTVYYKAFDPEGDDPSPEDTWLYLKAPCVSDCKIYEVTGCGGVVTWWPGEITGGGLKAHPGDTLEGILHGGCIGLKNTRQRQKVVRWLGVDYPLCELESYENEAAVCVDPTAPDVFFAEYTCTDCADCYEDPDDAPPATPKAGYVAGRHYEEVVYGADRAAAVNAAVARITEIQGSEGDVIPYAHTLVGPGGNAYAGGNNWMSGGIDGNVGDPGSGCCAGNWTAAGSYPRWADTAHVAPCDSGIKAGSTMPIPGDPGARWQTTLIMCCQCQESAQLCTGMAAGAEGNLTDFYGDVDSYRVLSAPVTDLLGAAHYCRDFDTAAAAADSWKGWADAAYLMDCWAWYNGVTVDPWDYTYDLVGTPGGGTSAYDCSHTTSNHALVHHPSRYEGGDAPASGYKLVCKQSAADNLYYWTGVYRECRWCDARCGETVPTDPPTPGACGTSMDNPCMQAWRTNDNYFGGGRGCGYGLLTPISSYCTEAYEATCAAYASDRHNHSSFLGVGADSEFPHSFVCDTSLIPQEATYNAVVGAYTCGVHVCAEKCGFNLIYSVGINPAEMYNRCSCGGSSSRMGAATPVVQDFIDIYQLAVTACKAAAITVSAGYKTCEASPEECCTDGGVSLAAADYTFTVRGTPPNLSGSFAPKSPWTNLSKRPLKTAYAFYMFGSWGISAQMRDYVCCEADGWWPDSSKVFCT